jgi:adenylate kinase
MVSIIGGIPGVGKTTVLELTGIKVVNFGTVMLELSGLADRDMIRGLSIEKQRELQSSAAKKISAMRDVVVDTHYTIKTQNGYLPGIPPWVAELLEMEHIIVIEADEMSIFERRVKDKSRSREVSLEEISEHQIINRNFAITLAQMKGALLSIVKNEEGNPDACAKKIKKIMGV